MLRLGWLRHSMGHRRWWLVWNGLTAIVSGFAARVEKWRGHVMKGVLTIRLWGNDSIDGGAGTMLDGFRAVWLKLWLHGKSR